VKVGLHFAADYPDAPRPGLADELQDLNKLAERALRPVSRQ
jgi:hypothetical protein